jgi:hypothetical protein
MSTRHTGHMCTNTLYDYVIIIDTYVSLMYELKKKLKRYLRVNLLGPGPRRIKKNYRAAVSQRFRNPDLECGNRILSGISVSSVKCFILQNSQFVIVYGKRFFFKLGHLSCVLQSHKLG